MIVAVDPGIRGCGVAIFESDKLVRAAYVPNLVEEGNQANEAASMAAAVWHWVKSHYDPAWFSVDELALEWPKIYATRIRRGETKEDPNDMVALAGVQSSIATLFEDAEPYSYYPSDWKGQMKKEPCHRRIQERLERVGDFAPLAKASDEAGSLAHNIWDAVGIGLFHVRRFDKKRVIPV